MTANDAIDPSLPPTALFNVWVSQNHLYWDLGLENGGVASGDARKNTPGSGIATAWTIAVSIHPSVVPGIFTLDLTPHYSRLVLKDAGGRIVAEPPLPAFPNPALQGNYEGYWSVSV